jgi:hypothetical protein
MARSRKGLLLLIGLFLVIALIFVLGPIASCAYKHYNFAKNIQVRIGIPSCITSTSGSKPCNYVFSFEGERDLHSIRFEGDNLRHEYDPGKATFIVTGLGIIYHHEIAISLGISQVFVNGQAVPAGQAPRRILVKRDGSLVSGYCEPKW